MKFDLLLSLCTFRGLQDLVRLGTSDSYWAHSRPSYGGERSLHAGIIKTLTDEAASNVISDLQPAVVLVRFDTLPRSIFFFPFFYNIKTIRTDFMYN